MFCSSITIPEWEWVLMVRWMILRIFIESYGRRYLHLDKDIANKNRNEEFICSARW